MSDTQPHCADYLQSLQHFPRYLANAWHELDGRRGYFGDPSHLENGIRSMGNVVFTAAMLATLPDYPEAPSLLVKARAGLAYLCEGHITGKGACADGKPWGGVWQSSWWTTRMALGARFIWSHLSIEERAAVERVVVHEADVQLPRIVPSGLAEDTKAEENAWDTEILATAIALFPEHPHRQAWWDKLLEFAYNTFSVARDWESNELADGKPLRERVYTVNLHGDFTLENHGAYHFCYVASPLHSLAWASYALLAGGITPPAALRHHVAEVWQRAKPTFLGNRFAYVGGQDWARYTYGAYFIVPALIWLQDVLGDSDARTIERLRFQALREEQLENDDGSFFGKRFTRFHYHGQPAKYETDCYANLALACCLHTLSNPAVPATPIEELPGRLNASHASPECGIAFVRRPALFASFSWRTLTEPHPVALFVPLADESLAEWGAHNLCGRIVLAGEDPSAVWVRGMQATSQGFHVQGTVVYRGKRGGILYTQELDYQVDADRQVARIKSRFVAQSKFFVRRAEGLHLAVPNDRFNGFKRTLWSAAGKSEIGFDPDRRPFWLAGRTLAQRITRRLLRETWRDGPKLAIDGAWVNIDDRLGVVALGEKGFLLRRPAGRNLPDGSLHYELLYSSVKNLNRYVQPGEEILNTDFLLLAGDAQATRELAAKPF